MSPVTENKGTCLYNSPNSLSHWPLPSVQFNCSVQLCDPTDCSTSGYPVNHQLSELAQAHVHWVVDAIHLILCHPLLLLPSNFPSIRVFSNESALCIRWPKYYINKLMVVSANEEERIQEKIRGSFILVSSGQEYISEEVTFGRDVNDVRAKSHYWLHIFLRIK